MKIKELKKKIEDILQAEFFEDEDDTGEEDFHCGHCNMGWYKHDKSCFVGQILDMLKRV